MLNSPRFRGTPYPPPDHSLKSGQEVSPIRGRSAWEAFQAGADPTGVSEQVLTSWRRSRWSGVDPASIEVPVVDVDTDSDFVRLASPVLLRAADLLTGGPACLALADPRGNVLWRWVSERSIGQALDEARMQEGASFGEERVGTNGIGTALECRTLAEVVGADHYVEAFHGWACVAAPVTHPITRRVMGAVNVTCFVPDANHFLRAMTSSLADGVASRLTESATAHERAMLDAFVLGQRRSTAPVLVVSERMMIADDVAGAWGLDHRAVWELARAADPGTDLVLKSGLRGRAHPLGEVAGVLLTLHPDAQTPAPSRSDVPGLSPLEAAEAEVIAGVLGECGGNKSAVAARLGISRATLYQKLRRYRIGLPGAAPFA
ncbi:helix-turn-helix domain-containing protein [Pseudonocardia sp. RS010]|uniref:helix-turn-helix domain-containing protein n=1 Tax=Pseudonocardia sp. RS010 TaxID=3385979 RepID=UPI0039A02E66